MWRQIKDWLHPRRLRRGPRFVIHKRYRLGLPFRHYDPSRPFRILAYLEKRKLLRRGFLRRPRPVSMKRLQQVHDTAYLHSLEQPGALEPIVGYRLDAADQDRFLCFQRLMSGGTLNAALNALANRGIAINLGGGFHHARPDAGSGFCIFNDLALAVTGLRERGLTEPILIVDLDLHDGDGTRACFAADPTVHTFSIHNRTLGECEAIASTCVELGPDVGDERYLAAVREHLPPVFEQVRPGFVFYLAGSDPAIEDPLGDWRISLQGMLARDRFVMGLIPAGTPCAIVLGGGYGQRAWRHGAAFFSWLLSGNADLDIPLELELPVGHYRHLTRWMKVPRLLLEEEEADSSDERDPHQDWGLSDDDLGLGGARRPRLFLGLFSRHAIELALEEAGLLERLRRKGFEGLQVRLDVEDPHGDLLRIGTGGEDPRTLIEIRLRIDRASEPGRSYLAVEWLLIQDAGSSFEMSRPLLPGQKHPGLGMLRDVAAALVVLGEKLELDGVRFTPSHYHLAALSRPVGCAPDPRDEGRFQALQHAVRELPLREAAIAVEAGRVLDRRTGLAWPWRPTPLVVPISRAEKRRFASDDYRSAAARARSGCDLMLNEPS